MIYDFYDLPQSGQAFHVANLDIGTTEGLVRGSMAGFNRVQEA